MVGIACPRRVEDEEAPGAVDAGDGDGGESAGDLGDCAWRAERPALVEGAAEIQAAADREALRRAGGPSRVDRTSVCSARGVDGERGVVDDALVVGDESRRAESVAVIGGSPQEKLVDVETARASVTEDEPHTLTIKRYGDLVADVIASGQREGALV